MFLGVHTNIERHYVKNHASCPAFRSRRHTEKKMASKVEAIARFMGMGEGVTACSASYDLWQDIDWSATVIVFGIGRIYVWHLSGSAGRLSGNLG